MQCNVVFSGKFYLVVGQNFSGGNKTSLAICDIERNLKDKKCIYFFDVHF